MTTDKENNFTSVEPSPSTSFNLEFAQDKAPPRRRERRRKIWNNSQMDAALTAIRSRAMGYHKAAKRYGVPRTTLFRLAKQITDPSTIGKRKKLTCDSEKTLIEYIQQKINEESSLTRDRIKMIVCDFAKQYSVADPLESDGVTEKNWFKRFFTRHANQFTLHNSTDFPAINCVDLFPNPPTYVETDFNLNSKQETVPLSAADDQDLNTIIVDENSDDTLEKFDEEFETEKNHPEVTEEDIEKIAEPNEIKFEETFVDRKHKKHLKRASNNCKLRFSKDKKHQGTENDGHLIQDLLPLPPSLSQPCSHSCLADKTLLKTIDTAVPAVSPSLSSSSYCSSGENENCTGVSFHKKRDKKKRHCFTCDIHFRHTHELLSHLKQHVSNPTVTLMRLANSDDKVDETTEKEREYEDHGSLKLTLKHSGAQHFEVVKSPLERPKSKGMRILTAKEIKQSPPHNTQPQQADAMAKSVIPTTRDNDQSLENRYFECPPLDGLDQYATEENHTEAADDLLKKLLEGGQQFQQDTDWSLNSNEYISIDRLANMCPVCHRSFPDVVQLYDHKRITGHDVPNVLPPAPIPTSLTQPNNYRPRMAFPSNHMTMGGFRPHMGPAMRPTFVGYPPQRFPPSNTNFNRATIIIRRPPPLYRGPRPHMVPSSAINHNLHMNSNTFTSYVNRMFNTPHCSNTQGPQVRQPVPLKPKPQRTIRPRTPHLQTPSPIGTPSPPSTMAAPSVFRPRLLKDILLETDFSPPPEKKQKTQQDDDCEIVSTSPGMDGLPVIQSVHGGVEQPQDNNSEKEAIQLNDQITLSLKNKDVNKNPKEVASILANRGITVTHKTKQPGSEEAIPKGQASADATQNQNSISIISKKKTNMPGGPSAAARSRRGDSSLISCPFTDCTEKFLSIEGLNKHTQKGHRIQKLTTGPVPCNLCPTLCSDQQTLIEHNRRNHQRCLKTSADELGIPVIDLRNEDTKQKLAALGITNYIPLSLKSANSCYGFPIVSVQGAANPNICNMSNLGVNSLLSLGPIKAIPTKKAD